MNKSEIYACTLVLCSLLVVLYKCSPDGSSSRCPGVCGTARLLVHSVNNGGVSSPLLQERLAEFFADIVEHTACADDQRSTLHVALHPLHGVSESGLQPAEGVLDHSPGLGEMVVERPHVVIQPGLMTKWFH